MLEKNLITQQQLEEALQIQASQKEKIRLGMIIYQLGYITRQELNQCVQGQISQIQKEMNELHEEVVLFEALSIHAGHHH